MWDIIYYTGDSQKIVPENFRDSRLSYRFMWTWCRYNFPPIIISPRAWRKCVGRILKNYNNNNNTNCVFRVPLPSRIISYTSYVCDPAIAAGYTAVSGTLRVMKRFFKKNNIWKRNRYWLNNLFIASENKIINLLSRVTHWLCYIYCVILLFWKI